MIPAPENLSKEAQIEWIRITTQLERHGIADTDEITLAQYCEAVSIYKTAQATWSKYQSVVTTNKQAQAILDKTIATMDRQTQIISRLGAQMHLDRLWQPIAQLSTPKPKCIDEPSAPKTQTYIDKIEPRINEIADWSRNGVTYADIAKRLGVGATTVKRYKKIYPPLEDALKSREEADAVVESSLYRRATGYDVTEKQEIFDYDQKGRLRKTGEKTFVRHIVADTTASLAWLNNRRPDQWRNNRQTAQGPDAESYEVALLRITQGTAAQQPTQDATTDTEPAQDTEREPEHTA